jgi:hypothetical protein
MKSNHPVVDVPDQQDPFAFLAELSPAELDEFRRNFTRSLEEADRDGIFTIEEVMAECEAIIAAAEAGRSRP